MTGVIFCQRVLFLTDMTLSIRWVALKTVFWVPVYKLVPFVPSSVQQPGIFCSQREMKGKILRFNLPISRITRLLDLSRFTTSTSTLVRWPIKAHWVINLNCSYLIQISNIHWELKQSLDKLSMIQFLFSLLIPPFLSYIDCFLDKGVYEIRLKYYRVYSCISTFEQGWPQKAFKSSRHSRQKLLMQV